MHAESCTFVKHVQQGFLVGVSSLVSLVAAVAAVNLLNHWIASLADLLTFESRLVAAVESLAQGRPIHTQWWRESGRRKSTIRIGKTDSGTILLTGLALHTVPMLFTFNSLYTHWDSCVWGKGLAGLPHLEHYNQPKPICLIIKNTIASG